MIPPGRAGKSSKKIMKHAMNPALRGQAELMGQVVQYLAEIKVTPFQLKNLLLLCPGSQTTVIVPITLNCFNPMEL